MPIIDINQEPRKKEKELEKAEADRQRIKASQERKQKYLALIALTLTIIILIILNWVRQKLKAQNKTINLLKGDVEHRFGNVLITIKGFIQAANDRLETPKAKEVIKTLENRVAATTLLFSELGELKDNNIEFQPYLEKLIDNIRKWLSRKGQTIHHHIDADILLNRKKAFFLTLMINELITNAYKHAFSK